MRNIKLLGNKIFVQKVPLREDQIKGSIHIPETAQAEPEEAIVTHIGTEVKDYKPGDKVLMRRKKGNMIEVDKIEYWIYKESDAIGLVLS